MSEHEKQASVIIPNWNGATLLPSCLDALRRQSVRDFEVIVVDNASTDESCELIDADYPEVRLLQLQRNLGLTGGCNAGIHMAKGEVIALLNNDAEAEAGWLAALIDGLARYPKAGSVASKMLLHDRRDIINSAGDFYGRDGLPGNRGVWQKDEGRYDEEAWVFGACGGAVAYRRSMLNQVGLFDPDFFMYCEDVDLAWRAQLAGWRCRYIPDAVVYHRLSATGGGPLSSFYTGRNTLYVLFKDVPISLRQKYRHLILRTQWRIARDALRAWRGKAARARLRGQLAGMMAWPKMRAKYQVVQRRRKVSDGYLESVLSEPAIEGREKREP